MKIKSVHLIPITVGLSPLDVERLGKIQKIEQIQSRSETFRRILSERWREMTHETKK